MLSISGGNVRGIFISTLSLEHVIKSEGGPKGITSTTDRREGGEKEGSITREGGSEVLHWPISSYKQALGRTTH